MSGLQLFTLGDDNINSGAAHSTLSGLASLGTSVIKGSGSTLSLGTVSGASAADDIMVINGTSAYVGIGTSVPVNFLHIKGDAGGVNQGVFVSQGAVASGLAAKDFLYANVPEGQAGLLGPLYANDGAFKQLYFYAKDWQDPYYTVQWYFNGTAYFTGQHSSYSGVSAIKTDSNLDNYIGLIIKSVGVYSTDYTDDKIAGVAINNSWPVFDLTNADNDKKVYGVITNQNNSSYSIYDNIDTGFSNNLDGKIRINSVGEGGIWVCNKNGALENGDYISSTTVTGYGGKQTDSLLHNYTVAKITCDCDFSLTKVVKKKVKLVNDSTGKVISFDSSGNIEYEDILDAQGNQQMVYPLKTRFLQADGTLLTDEADYNTRLANGEEVYIACFAGCTYHCG